MTVHERPSEGGEAEMDKGWPWDRGSLLPNLGDNDQGSWPPQSVEIY